MCVRTGSQTLKLASTVIPICPVIQLDREPGLTLIQPGMDRVRKVNMRIVTMPVPAQDGITRDYVTVRVDAVAYFRVSDPVRGHRRHTDYVAATGQVAQTSRRSIIGKSDLED
jgi:regulator of protease activity HflC (stomatin/prohibitin superfamily)